jgi:uncharacterized protein
MLTKDRDAVTAPAGVVATVAPVTESQRIAALDMLRGVAVLGILLMNIWVFGINLRGDGIAEIYSRPGSADFWSFALITILFEGKMRALFCMLFGAGILLFATNKEVAGSRTITRLFYVRMFWLVIFGVVNAHVLLWEGDILYFYGLFGMLVYLLRRMPPVWKATAVPIVAIIGFVLTTTFIYGIRTQRLAYVEARAAVESGRTVTSEQNAALASWREIEVTFIPNAEDRANEIEAMRGSYGEVAAIVHKHAWELETTLLPTLLGDNIALMLLGMALLQWGFFTARWTSKAYTRTMAIGYGLGLPLVTYSFWYGYRHTPDTAAFLAFLETHPINWVNLIYPVQRILLVMAHCSLLMILWQKGAFQWLFARLRAVGQMALTNYLMQSVLCTVFFFGYGFGFYERLAFHQIYAVVLAVWALQLAYSPIWLRHFRFGPMEWLWRSLTYWQAQPMWR